MKATITSFRGDFEFLSNMYRSAPFIDCDAEWKTVEHYYQAAKTGHPDWIKSIYDAQSPAEAKKLGKRCPIRKDWEFLKIMKMHLALRMKFRQNLDIAKKLISTHNFDLIEGNRWHDNFWGHCLCSGTQCQKKPKQNRLGKLLMTVRDELMQDPDFILKIVKEFQ